MILQDTFCIPAVIFDVEDYFEKKFSCYMYILYDNVAIRLCETDDS